MSHGLQKRIDLSRIVLYLVIGAVVYASYIVLPGQYFITYRAQAASVLSVMFVGMEVVQITPFKGVVKKVDQPIE